MNLYVDMDGVLAEYKNVPVSVFYEPGYFRNLKPTMPVVEGLSLLMGQHPEINVSILSCILSDRPNAEKEKLEWLNAYCPFLENAQKILIPCGENKKDYVMEGDNFLLDDYSKNVIEFDDGINNHGIKLINGLNGKGEQWKGSRIDIFRTSEEFARDLYNIMAENSLPGENAA